jgi:hypothetical protein
MSEISIEICSNCRGKSPQKVGKINTFEGVELKVFVCPQCNCRETRPVIEVNHTPKSGLKYYCPSCDGRLPEKLWDIERGMCKECVSLRDANNILRSKRDYLVNDNKRLQAELNQKTEDYDAYVDDYNNQNKQLRIAICNNYTLILENNKLKDERKRIITHLKGALQLKYHYTTIYELIDHLENNTF